MNLYNFEAATAMLGKELVRARQHRRMTRSALAMDAGISRVTLANLEAGRGSLSSLIAVLTILGHRFADQLPEVELGRSIARSRKRAALSQERLCALARVSKPALVRVERGEGNVATLVAAMDALSLSLSLIDVAIEATPIPLPAATARLLHGDCRDLMRSFVQQGMMFDAIVTDPPYHLSSISRRLGRKQAAPLSGGEPGSANPYRTLASGFMQQTWDGGDIAFDVDTWRAVHAVLKPGGHLVAFGGTRTFHRLAVAIEDAGFEIRDQIMWLFGSGFPKSHNLKGEHQGQGTALKPAYEPILVARRPIRESSVAANVLRFRTGSINIDACRVPTDEVIEMGRAGRKRGSSVALEGVGLPTTLGGPTTHRKGRWPANVIHDGIDESWGRYFYSAKASKYDRGPGNSHPTVKPNDLMRYLVRLVTPPSGTVLDPFMGSGSTGVAALQQGFSFVGCEQQADYIEIARGRIAKVKSKSGSPLSELQPEETPAIRNAS
ncbi:DNA methyltransferase [Bosea beijingensis]|uniref:DNA methyltransferase n=1 Tax=Bosea beijingensis TaxID=3068632 RepID=UPI00274158EE|nr:DNA methyltransferase [Bosea sp. REN20]